VLPSVNPPWATQQRRGTKDNAHRCKATALGRVFPGGDLIKRELKELSGRGVRLVLAARSP
jgi:hypothetical protein